MGSIRSIYMIIPHDVPYSHHEVFTTVTVRQGPSHVVPCCLTMSLASLVRFLKEEAYLGLARARRNRLSETSTGPISEPISEPVSEPNAFK
jgi:hypothetical protein